MAQSVPVQPMPEFNPDAEVGASVATRWTTWLSDFEMFLLASGITDTKRQRALLLYTAGPRVREIFKQIPNNGDENNFNTAKEKLTEYFQPQTNRRYEVYRFRQTKQNQEESLDHSILAYEHLPKIVNLRKTIWTSKSNNKFWWVVRPPESVNGL